MSASVDRASSCVRREQGDEPPPAGPQGPLQKSFPDSPQGRVAAAYLKAFSSGDAATMRTFIEAQMTPGERSLDDRVRRYQEIFADNGVLTLLGVRVAPDSSLAIQVNSAQNGEMTLLMSFEPAAPFRITGLQFRLER